MSALSTSFTPVNVPGSTTGSSSSTASSATPSGFSSLTSNDFMQMLIAELKNQDPTQPMDNSQLLQQLTQMQSMQSSVELNSTLTNLSNNQQVTAGAAFLGKQITGVNAQNQQVSGIATQVTVASGVTTLTIGNNQVTLPNVTGISLPPATPSVPAATTPTGG